MSVLADIQRNIRTKLLTKPFFVDEKIAIITEDLGDLETAISTALSRLGISIVILMAEADVQRQNVPGPYLDNLRVIVLVAENVILNRTGEEFKTALDVVENILTTIHLFKPAGVNETFVAAKDAIRASDPPKPATVAYEVAFTTSAGLQLTE